MIGNLPLSLSAREGGVVIGQIDPAMEPLKAVVNSALTGGSMKGLRRLLEQGLQVDSNPGIAIARPYPEDDLAPLKAQWEALTGEPAGDDVYILQTKWDRKRVLVPRLALLSLFDRLEVMRGGPAAEPPDEDLRYLESKAAEADLGGEGAGGKAKGVLALLEGHGFFDPKFRDANWERVGKGRYPVLESYLRAIDALLAYYRTPERAEYIQPPDFPPVVGGPVSLEWFRKGVPTPEGINPLSWLAFAEWLLRTSTLETPGNEIYQRVGGETYHLRFRREDGEHRALTSAERLTRAR